VNYIYALYKAVLSMFQKTGSTCMFDLFIMNLPMDLVCYFFLRRADKNM